MDISNTSDERITRPPRHGTGRLAAVLVLGLLLVAGCSSDQRLSSDGTLDPLVTDPLVTDATAPTTVVVTTLPTATTVPIATVPAATTTVPVPAVTMSPPIVIPGSTVVPVAPPTTQPPATAPTGEPPATDPAADPPATEPAGEPPATDPTASCESCGPDYRFPFPSFFDVPQLGTEPVRGTGCGANASIGEVVPDGIWEGHISVGATAVKIDLKCVYYDASAQPYVDQCIAQYGEDECLEGGTSFWVVNNSTRTRSVPLDPSFRRRYAVADGCADPGPGQGAEPQAGSDDMDSWIVVEGGAATFALTSCVYG